MRYFNKEAPFSRGLRVLTVGLATLLTTVTLQAQQERPPDRAYRLSGTYENGRVVSLQATPLELRLPLTVTERVLGEAVPADGYLLEILDGDAKSLQRLRIDDPSFVLMEYVDSNEPGHIVSKQIHVDRVEFSILVPAPIESHMLRFMKVAPGQEATAAEKRQHDDIGSFILPATGSGRATPVSDGGVQ